MHTTIKNFSYLIIATLFLISCKDEVGPLTDIRPAIPVTITNASDFRPDPTVTTSLSGTGAIQISINAAGRKIKEVNVVTGTTYTAIQGTGPFYIPNPIAVNATSFTFVTSITEYFLTHPVSASNPPAAANAELARRFYFLITLDDGTVIVSRPVRVLVLS